MKDIFFDINKFRNARIVVFGDMMIDEYLNGEVSRISPEAPVPVVHVRSREKRLGGAGNVVRNLCSLGARVSAISYVGNDDGGAWLTKRLNGYSVNTSGIIRGDDTITSIKTRVTSQHQQLLRYDCEEVKNAPKSFEEQLSSMIDQLLAQADALIISDYGKGVVTKSTAKIAIDAANKVGIPVIVDPKGNDYSKYSGASVCTPNMKELSLVVGKNLNSEEDICSASIQLCSECNIKYILATRSEKGMSLIDGASGAKKDYPALAKEVIDVTGAGDTVISAFTLCFALGAEHDDCCRIANIAASIVVSKFGAAVASPEEIQALIYKKTNSDTKIMSMEEAQMKAAFLHQQGKKIVFTNGCFDIVHAGHISSFIQARSFGDVLFVGVNSDTSIKRIKGNNRPIVDQNNRLKLLESISYIDYLVMFETDTPEELIRAIQPDVLIKGKDWEGKEVAGGNFIKEHGGELRFIDLEQGLSTTNIIKKIIKSNEKA